MALKGSCLCKTVQYEADALASPIGHCHCHTCRKASASAYTSTARVARSAFRIISGEGKADSLRVDARQAASPLLCVWDGSVG